MQVNNLECHWIVNGYGAIRYDHVSLTLLIARSNNVAMSYCYRNITTAEAYVNAFNLEMSFIIDTSFNVIATYVVRCL